MTLHLAHRYMLITATASAPSPSPTILDFGCGSGEIVEVGRQAGLEIFGVDTFSDDEATRTRMTEKGWLGTIVREITDGTIPFEANRFDAVICNQVLDAVPNLEAVLREIHRVLKPSGTFLCAVPTREQVREGHIGIPFAHWFPKGSRTRYSYTLAMRTLGFGYFKDHRTIRQWTRDALEWLDRHTIYRDRASVTQSFARWFTVSDLEPDYVEYRLTQLGLKQLGRLSHSSWLQPVIRRLFRRLASPLLLARKPVPAQ